MGRRCVCMTGTVSSHSSGCLWLKCDPQPWGFAVSGTSSLAKGKDSVKSSAVLAKEMLYFSLCSGVLFAMLKSLIDIFCVAGLESWVFFRSWVNYGGSWRQWLNYLPFGQVRLSFVTKLRCKGRHTFVVAYSDLLLTNLWLILADICRCQLSIRLFFFCLLSRTLSQSKERELCVFHNIWACKQRYWVQDHRWLASPQAVHFVSSVCMSHCFNYLSKLQTWIQ